MSQGTRHHVKRAQIKNPGKDTGRHHTVEVDYLGKSATVDLLSPYGLYSTPLNSSLMAVFNVMGHEENRIGIAHDPDVRFRNLGPGEVVVGSPSSRNYVFFRADGTVSIKSPKDFSVNVAENGVITVEGNVTINVQGDTKVISQGNVDIQTDGNVNLGASTGGSGTLLAVKLSDDSASSNVFARKA